MIQELPVSAAMNHILHEASVTWCADTLPGGLIVRLLSLCKTRWQTLPSWQQPMDIINRAVRVSMQSAK